MMYEGKEVWTQENFSYQDVKIDAAMKLICGDSQDFIPFEQRYEWLPEIRYDRRG